VITKRKPVLKSAIDKTGEPKVKNGNSAGPQRKISKESLVENLQRLEPQRIAIRNHGGLGMALAAPAIISHILDVNLFEIVLGDSILPVVGSWTLMIVLALVGLGFGISSWKKYKKYKSQFKKNIVGPIFRSIAPQLFYRSDSAVGQHIYNSSKIFKRKCDRYSGDDHVTGKIGQTDIEFSELHTEYYTTVQTKNGKRKRWHTIFRGLFFTADFHKHINGETYILPDFVEKRFGIIGKFLQKRNPLKHAKNLVQLENPLFEKEFAIYASDEQEARYCLTPKMMEDLLALKQQFPRSKMYCSILGSKIHIALTMKNQFEPRVWRQGADPKQIDQMANLFKNLTSIVEQLNLNTRIWSKKAS